MGIGSSCAIYKPYVNPGKLHMFLLQGMMIDEADEFVAGPQNKHKRPGEPNMQGIPKRRRCMSPLLRGRQQNPIVNNHIGGKGPPVPMTQAQPDLIKPLPLHKSKSLFLFFLNVIYCFLVLQRRDI